MARLGRGQPFKPQIRHSIPATGGAISSLLRLPGEWRAVQVNTVPLRDETTVVLGSPSRLSVEWGKGVSTIEPAPIEWLAGVSVVLGVPLETQGSFSVRTLANLPLDFFLFVVEPGVGVFRRTLSGFGARIGSRQELSQYLINPVLPKPLVFFMTTAFNHITPAVGLTPTVTLSSDGQTFVPAQGAVSEVGEGWYQVAANSLDQATPGPLLLHATAATADPTDEVFLVI